MATLVRIVIICVCLFSCQCAQGESTQDRFLDSNGAHIRYQVWGQGPAVILLHGFGETLETWQRGDVVRLLARDFQVIAMDVRGHGHSSKPQDKESYGVALAGDVMRVLRELNISQAHVVGYSLGALIALDFAILYPEHALSVVLGGAGWNPPETLKEFAQHADAYERGRIPLRAGDNAKALAALLRSLRVLSEAEIRRIRVPIAVLIGAEDRFMPNVQRLSRVVPAVLVTVIPNANHATAPTHPKFVETLSAFLLQQKNTRR